MHRSTIAPSPPAHCSPAPSSNRMLHSHRPRGAQCARKSPVHPRSLRFLGACLAVLSGCSSAASSDAPDAATASDAGSHGDTGASLDADLLDAGKDGTRSFADADSPDRTAPPIVGKAQVVVRHNDGRWLRIEPTAGAAGENLSQSLTKLSAGQDDVISVSADAGWLVLSTSRFGCSSSGCLALVKSDLSAPGQLVKPNGQEIFSAGRPVVASGGALIVFEMRGPHAMDLYATTLKSGAWTAPVLLTAASAHPFNHDPALSPDGTTVIFDCGPDPYGDTAGTEACESMTDGSGTRVAFPLASIPSATAAAYSQRPGYAPDGSLVFEGNPGQNEQIYRVARGGAPALVNRTFGNDNSPCVLHDGRILSFWLGRAGNSGSVHELKVMNADGSGYAMLITNEDLVDIGITCGG